MSKMLTASDVQEGATYFCDDQRFRTVRKLSGRKVEWIIAKSGRVGECGIGQFAAMCVHKELED